MNEETTNILIDTAFASGAASALDPEERQLQELVLAMRDDAPSPDPDFALRMDAEVAAGFPKRRSGLAAMRERTRIVMTTRPQLIASGAAASLLIGLVVVFAVAGSGPSSDRIASTGGGSGATELAAPAQKAIAPNAATPPSADSIAPVSPSPGGFVAGRSRKIERSAALVLGAPKDKLGDVGDQVIAVTDRYRGFVLRSSVTSSGQNESSSGSFDLRIPVGSLRPALRDMSALADVQSRTEKADDITATFTSARTRLQELNAERRGLLRRLEKALTEQASAAIRSRIRIVNAQINAQTAVMRELRRRTSYATVSVTLVATKGGASGGGISDGARDLRDGLVDSANVALRVLGFALPIGLVLGLLWLASGRVNRRRREAVLD